MAEAWIPAVPPNYLVNIVVIKNAVKVLVDFIEHVNHLHRGAVVAEGGESHNVTEINGDLFKQLWLHLARLLQGTHNCTVETQRVENVITVSYINAT